MMFESVPSSNPQDVGDGGPIEDGGGGGGGYYGGGGGGYYGGGGGGDYGGGGYSGGAGGGYGNYAGGVSGSGSGYGDGTFGSYYAAGGSSFDGGDYGYDSYAGATRGVQTSDQSTGDKIGLNLGNVTQDTYDLLGHEVTIDIDNNTIADPQGALGKIEAAVDIINAAGAAGNLTEQQQADFGLINGLVASDGVGRSGVDVQSGDFTLKGSELDQSNSNVIASDIGHDSNHVDQFLAGQYDGIVYTNGVPNAGSSMNAAVQNEVEATQYQAQLGPALGLSQNQIDFYNNYASDSSAIQARLSQTFKGH